MSIAAALVLLCCTRAAAQDLIVLHDPAHNVILVNPHQITSLRGRQEHPQQKHFAAGLECQINLADGKFVAVTETCDVVRALMKLKP